MTSSCGYKEEIQPLYAPKKIDSGLANNGELKFSIPIDIDQGYDDQFKNVGKVKNIGGFFRAWAEILADVDFQANNETIDIDPTTLDYPELGDVDFDFFKSLELRSVLIHLTEDAEEEADLKFISEIELFIKFEGLDPILSEENDPESQRIKILGYNKDANEDALDCFDKCIELQITPLNWKALLAKYRKFTIEPVIKIHKAPKWNLSLGGQIDFSVTPNIDF